MAFGKYQKLKLQYSYNGGFWADVKPLQFKKGELIEENSTDCGYANMIYRWVNADKSDYICFNQSKYYKQIQQVSYDNGLNWYETGEIQTGDLIEPNSYDCDYGVTWEKVDDIYYCELSSFTDELWEYDSTITPYYLNNGFEFKNVTSQVGRGNYFYLVNNAGTELKFRGIEHLVVAGYANTKYLTDMSSMFYRCFSLKKCNFKAWDTSNVTNMSTMFFDTTNLKYLDLSSFNVNKVENMSSMFQASGIISLNISGWDMTNCTNYLSMFSSCENLTKIYACNCNGITLEKINKALASARLTSQVTVITDGCEQYNEDDRTYIETNYGNLYIKQIDCEHIMIETAVPLYYVDTHLVYAKQNFEYYFKINSNNLPTGNTVYVRLGSGGVNLIEITIRVEDNSYISVVKVSTTSNTYYEQQNVVCVDDVDFNDSYFIYEEGGIIK